jgi:hypothetical protein
VKTALAQLALSALACFLMGCSTGTVIEKDVPGSALPHATVGFVHWLYAADGKTHIGAAFTSEGHDTYNWELSQHGQDLMPPRGKDFGVTINGSEYDLTEEAVDNWGLMATWSRSAEHPAPTLLQKAGL